MQKLYLDELTYDLNFVLRGKFELEVLNFFIKIEAE